MTAAPHAQPDPQAASAVRSAFAAHPELELLADDATQQRLIANGYFQSVPVSPAHVARGLSREADELLQAVAFGYDGETVARGEVLLDEFRSDHALEHGQPRVSDVDARALTDICLYVVRALEHRGDAARARQRARDCYTLIPDLVASEQSHPPAIRELAETARQQSNPGFLRARVIGNVTHACVLRIQGRLLPLDMSPMVLVPGAYLVQAECEEPELLHHVDIRAGETVELAIDVGFERALGFGRGGLTFAPTGQSASREGRRAQLSHLASLLDVSTLWMVSSNAVELSISRHVVAADADDIDRTATVPLSPRATLSRRVEEALSSISCGAHCAQSKVDGPVNPLAITTASIGGVAVLGSWGLFIAYAAADSKLGKLTHSDDGYADKLHSRDTLGTAALISSSAGSLLLAGASVSWLPERESTPWWAYASGAAGVAAVGGGALLWSGHGDTETTACPDEEKCLRRRSRVPLGPMLVTQGAALLSIPITYAFRSLTGSDGELSVRATRDDVEIGYRIGFGEF